MTYPSDDPELVGGKEGQDALKCFILNTAGGGREGWGAGTAKSQMVDPPSTIWDS